MKEIHKIEDLGKYKSESRYRRAFKMKVVEDLISNHEGESFIERKHGLPSATLRHFKKTLLEELGYYRILEEMNKKEQSAVSHDEVSELKKALELATMKVAALETLIDVAEEQFNIDIRKKGGSKQSK